MKHGIARGYSAVIALSLALGSAAFSGAAADATTKGLNQIVTPDVQPLGQLSLSYQQVDPNIANPEQVQLELGVAREVELALFQGFNPDEQIGGLEIGLVDKHPYLLSTGFINWSTKGDAPQPFLEAGFYQGNTELVAGIIDGTTDNTTQISGATSPPVFQPFALGNGGSTQTHTSRSLQSILGIAYRVHPRTLLQVDYQSGSSNFATAGFTYNITPQLQFNPALYISNTTPYKGYGYAVLTWNITAWGGSSSGGQNGGGSGSPSSGSQSGGSSGSSASGKSSKR